MTTETLTVNRYVGDNRDIAFYMMDISGNPIPLTGSIMSCKFTADSEVDVNTSIELVLGDGRAHIPIAAGQVDLPVEWKMVITGTNGSGDGIAPIIGSLTINQI